MAKLPTVRRISREDLRDKDVPKWVDQLLRLINNFFETVYSALASNLTFDENIRTQTKKFIITGGANPQDNIFEFLLTLPTAPIGLHVINVYETQAPNNPVTAAVFCSWRRESTQMIISSISGLTNGTEYAITVRVD